MKNVTLPIRFGIVISASLIAYFLFLALFNLHTNPIFSLGNGLITAFGIYEVIKYYKIKVGKQFTYANGFKQGLIAGFVGALIFSAFFLLYATEVNPLFLAQLLEVFEGQYNVGAGMVTFVVAIMGFSTTVVLTLTFMQLFKDSRNTPNAEGKRDGEITLKKVS